VSRALAEYFGTAESFDAFDYGFDAIRNFLARPGLLYGVSMLPRTVFLERCARFERLFCEIPPTKVAQLVERVSMVKRRLDPKASTATSPTCRALRRQAT